MRSQRQSLDEPKAAKILVVDDSPDNLYLLRRILVKKGYKVQLAGSGKLALSSLESFQADLILLDIMMPEMDGFMTCQHLKANPETANIPIIFLSGLDNSVNKVKAFQIGGNDYITKPFEAEEVLARISYQLSLQYLQTQLQQKNQVLIQQNEELQRAQQETKLLLEATWAIEKSHNLKEAIGSILDVVCTNISWDYGEGWLPNSEKNLLEYVTQSSHCSGLLKRFQEQSCQIKFLLKEGLAGRILQSQKPEWIEDCSTTSESVYQRTKLAVEAGLKAVFGVPILGEENLLAILVFYQTEASPCQSRILELVQAVATQLSSSLKQAQLKQELRKVNQELERIANLDGLTQIANRRHFNQKLQQEWLRMQRLRLPLSLILCDIDYFKRYNDHYGHLAGDECIIQIAQILSQSVKRAGDFVARYGGEEFAIILPHTSAEGVVTIAERIHTTILQEHIPHADSPRYPIVTLSLGISRIIPSSNHSPQFLIQLADQALYEVKRNGRNGYSVASTT